MKKFLEKMYDSPFVELTESFKEIKTINNRFYLQLPDILRRCYFMQPSEKLVLLELISWAASNKESDEVGYCSVPEPIIRGNTNLSRSTIKNAIKSLQEKKFITVRKYYNSRNRYMINSLTENPYALLSEYVHWRRQELIGSWEKVETSFNYDFDLPLIANIYTEATLDFVSYPKYYASIIERIRLAYGNNFIEQYEAIMDDVCKMIDEIYETIGTRMYGPKNSVHCHQ
ncbi:hypothetical protein [Paenibacillus agricola]|uniref:Helix-turn-helix domain-containing protein n=1 Tax=Paenibacillus agricola TaxID=2716264 RepID=A0ABX0J345_9BACL|nr:hypothetical protein [Paenibacillus agricola]NHN28541.1 hypothetical protein [Paenibacillus agricola]